MTRHKKLKGCCFILFIILYVFCVDPALKFGSHLFLIKHQDVDLYKSGKYADFPGGSGASRFLPEATELPAGSTIDFLYENPCLEQINVLSLVAYLQFGSKFEHTFSLTLYFDEESRYQEYKEKLYEDYNLYNEHKITHLSDEHSDKLLHTIPVPADYAGIYFDDEHLLVKYVYFYLFDSKSDPYFSCVRRTTTFYYLLYPQLGD